MEVETTQGEGRIIHATGEIDLSNVADLRTALDAAVRESPDGFVLDLADAQYIDSAGIAAIMAAYQRLHRKGGMLALVIASANLKEIFGLIHLEALPGLVVRDNLHDAIGALSRRARRQ